jgi:hypothetical protein
MDKEQPESIRASVCSGAVLTSGSMCAFWQISSNSLLLFMTISFSLLVFSFVNLSTSASICMRNENMNDYSRLGTTFKDLNSEQQQRD